MRRLISAFSVAAVLVAVLGIAATASAANSAQVVKVPFIVSSSATAAIKACVGENVVFTGGKFNVVIQSTETLFVFHRNVIAGLGTGDVTGTVYHATGHIQAVDVLPPSGGEAFTYELTLNVVGEGNAGQFTAHAVQHLTVTPQGDLSSTVEIFAIRCR